MQPLIDGDILKYEIGFAAEAKWRALSNSDNPPPFDVARELLLDRIQHICDRTNADTEPIFFFTGATNFRNEIAKTRKYKDRKNNKPYHYDSLEAFMYGELDCKVYEGLEADDLMAIEQTNRPEETIICSRDKDLKQVPGWHFSWELGHQPQFGPELVTEYGYLNYRQDKKKLEGVGEKYFYSQILTGDSIDSIPGLRRVGGKKAFELLGAIQDSREELYKTVRDFYQSKLGDTADEALLENAQLVFLIRELDEEGKPIMWRPPV